MPTTKALPPPPQNLAEAKANFNKQLLEVGNYLIKSIQESGAYSRIMTNIVDKWSKGQASPDERKQVVNAAMANFGALIGGGTAFHGSPHAFEKFSMEKVGTGQGAQSYGHGLYFAENPEVAQTYAGDLGWKSTATPNRNSGFMYRVNIPDEHIAKMLDWDKPLSEQAPEIQKSLGQFFKVNNAPGEGYLVTGGDLRHYTRTKEEADKFIQGLTGEQIYRDIHQLPEDASWKLNLLGIPGIKYLDQGSRVSAQDLARAQRTVDLLEQPGALSVSSQSTYDAAKALLKKGYSGTRNFVVFDENILKDVKRTE